MSYNRQPPIHVDCIIHQYAQNAVIEAHCVPWGELNFALHGVINLHAENTNYISPPQYAIWLPPNTAHSAYSQANTRYITLVIAPEYCAVLLTGIKLIEISPILLSIVHDFSRRDIRRPETPADQRLAQVLIDQIQQARCYDHYLPWSYHAKLEPVLWQIQQQPASLVTLQQYLLRLSQQELGMSLNEWRSRAKLLLAIDVLKQHSIRNIAHYLGYHSSSAFIGMFQRMTGKSPSQLQLRRHY